MEKTLYTDGSDVDWSVLNAAVGWWERHRPVGWTETEHLNHPAINTVTDAEESLAMAVADLVRDQESR
jgi:hypothetical protein